MSTTSKTAMKLPLEKPQRLKLSNDSHGLLMRLAMLLVLCSALSAVAENFLSISNLSNVMRQASLLFIIASGATVVMIAGGIDLSIGANVTLSGVCAALVVQATNSPALGLCTGVFVGAFVGLVNGLLITWLRLPAFLATYGMLWILNGVALYLTHGAPIFGMPQGMRMVGTGFLWGVPVPVLIMLVTLATGALMLQRTSLGRQILFMGANREAAFLSGVPVGRNLIGIYMLSGLTAGLAALIFVGRVNSADPGMGDALVLPAIAAILVGGTSLAGGSGGLANTLLGALMLTLILNGMNLMAVKTEWQPFVTGVVLVLAMLADTAITYRKR